MQIVNQLVLTPLEERVYKHWQAGKAIADIAEHICLAPRTVEFYLQNLRVKLSVQGVSNE